MGVPSDRGLARACAEFSGELVQKGLRAILTLRVTDAFAPTRTNGGAFQTTETTSPITT
jgi:hypothetical protein